MSREISATAKEAIFAQETSQVFLVIIEIDHSDLTTPLRFVNNNENIVSNGNTYEAFPFEFQFPNDSEDESSARLSICNIDRQIVAVIRSLTSAPTVTVSVILASTPDIVEMGPYTFLFQDTTYTFDVVSGSLAYENKLGYRASSESYLPQDFPGLF